MEALIREAAIASRTRSGRQSSLSSISPPEDEEELRLVMQEIADALGADAIVLTVQNDDEGRSLIMRISNTRFDEQVLLDLHADNAFRHDEAAPDVHHWRNVNVDRSMIDLMIMPVKRTPGHLRMVLSALFRSLDKRSRAAAERVYLARRPFAVGYFRLWQLDRTRHSREKALEAALDSLGVGFALIDADTNIVFANTVARDMLSAGDGLRLDGQRIHATNLTDAMRLRTALDHVSANPVREAPMLTVTRASAVPLTLLALPIERSGPEIGSVAAALYFIDPATNVNAVLEPLCQIYQLTSSETKLACLLASGRCLAESAEKLRIKEQTGRSVLKQIFRKTGTTRQAELITLMYSSIVRVHHSIKIKAI